MDKITEKFTRDEVALCSPFRLASLVRMTEKAKDGDKIKFQGRILIAHRDKDGGSPCCQCCFDLVEDLCDFVSCLPEERKNNDWCYYTVEPKGKEGSHE